MEKVSSQNTIPSILVDIFSLHLIFDSIYNLSSFILNLFHFHVGNSLVKHDNHVPKKQSNTARESYSLASFDDNNIDHDETSLFGRDVHMVMEKLGIQNRSISLEGGYDAQKRWGCEEIRGIFDEEPSLQEVKEAFGVFDKNGDGFIDAEELQRVVCVLGFKEGLELEACRNMIRVFDENKDGKIDFNEFVRLMLRSF